MNLNYNRLSEQKSDDVRMNCPLYFSTDIDRVCSAFGTHVRLKQYMDTLACLDKDLIPSECTLGSRSCLREFDCTDLIGVKGSLPDDVSGPFSFPTAVNRPCSRNPSAFSAYVNWFDTSFFSDMFHPN